MIILLGQELFSGREHILEILRKNKENLKRGQSVNYSLIGQKNSGKTSILKQFILKNKDIKSIYIDLNKISLSPENFSIELITEIISQIKGQSTTASKLSTLKLTNENTIYNITNELEKIKPDQNKLIGWAIDFLNQWAKKDDFKAVFCIDEFHRIINFNNFSQVKDVISLFKEHINQWDNVSLITTSSAITEMSTISKKLDFNDIEVSGMDRESVKELTNKLINVGEKEVSKIHTLSGGIPIYVYAICKRYQETKDIEKAFVIETLSKQGLMYNILNLSLQENLNRARGQTLLFSIIKVLASSKPLRLTDISSKIYRSGPVTKSLVDRLVRVDIVSKNNKLFSISDYVMKYFINNIFVLDNELDFIIDKIKVNKLAKNIGGHK